MGCGSSKTINENIRPIIRKDVESQTVPSESSQQEENKTKSADLISKLSTAPTVTSVPRIEQEKLQNASEVPETESVLSNEPCASSWDKEGGLSPDIENILKDQKIRRKLKERLKNDLPMLLNELISAEVLSETDAQEIEEGTNSEQRAEKLLGKIENRPNKKFESFCNCLIAVGLEGVVYDWFITEGYINSAKEHLCKYVEKQGQDLFLYATNREPSPESVTEHFVHMEWIPNVKQESAKETLNLENYLSMVLRSFNKNNRFVISGISGIGKTALLQKICNLWARAKYTRKSNFEEKFSEYCIIPLMLHDLPDGHGEKLSLIEILRLQMKANSEANEIHYIALSRFIKENPDTILLLLDGYEDKWQKETINSILLGYLYPEVKVILTCRLYGISLLKHLGSCVLGNISELLGFNQQQQEKYIKVHAKKKSEKLIKLLREQSNEDNNKTSELFRNPILLQMKCLVYVNGKDDKEDFEFELYKKFVQHFLHNFERKSIVVNDKNSLTQEKKIFEKYADILLKIGSVANNFDEYGRLDSVINKSIMEEKLEEHFNTTIDIGFMDRVPDTNLEEQRWTFSIPTLQEYFLAYYLVHTKSTEELSRYEKVCDSVDQLKKQEKILQFLCGMKPDLANRIVQNVAGKTEKGNEGDCKTLQILERDLVPYFKNEDDMDFKLPKTTDIREEHENDKILLLSDNKAENQNVERLKITNIENPHCRKTYHYLNDIIIDDTLQNNGEIGNTVKKSSVTRLGNKKINGSDTMDEIAKELKIITTVTVNSDKDYSPFLLGLPKGNLQSLTLQKLQTMQQWKSNIEKMNRLEYFEIREAVASEILNDICDALRKKESLSRLVLKSNQFPRGIVKLNRKVQLYLKIECTNQSQSKGFVDLLNIKKSGLPYIHTLDLQGNPLGGSGHIIGQLWLCIRRMKKMNLARCGINSDTLKEAAEVLNVKSELELGLEELILRGNGIQNGGKHLANILKILKHLIKLDLHKTYLKDTNVAKLNHKETECTLTKLYINTDFMMQKTLGNVLCISEKFEVLCMHYDNGNYKDYYKWKDFSGLKLDSVSTLKVISFKRMDLSKGRLCRLMKQLPHGLKALAVINCNITEMEDIAHLLVLIPTSLTHLDITRNYYTMNLAALCEMKDYMQNLKKLNIGSRIAEYVEDLRQVFREDLPELNIYCDLTEDMWDIYT